MTFPNQLIKHQAGGVTLFSNSIELSPQLIETTKNLHSVTNCETIAIYKKAPRKCVLLIRQPSEEITELVLKGYPLSKLKDQLKHKRFGWQEALNLLQAKALGIRTPHFYGYIEARKYGFTTANGVLIQRLSEHRTLMEMIHDSQDDIFDIIDLAIPVISEFYEKGVNYIDMSPHNLMSNGGELPLTTIDWQNCAFIEQRNDRQLILHSAQFLHYLHAEFPNLTWTTWMHKVHDSCQPKISLETFTKAVTHFTYSKRPRKSLRYALDFDLNSLPTSR
jgi:tRNA A-37 threonylcarbamoyl transferase component Bud32